MRIIQRYLFWLLLGFLAVGLVYPLIGLLAVICMMAPVLLSFYKGRYWCGNFCPRGSFYDHVLAKISPKKQIPSLFRQTNFRIAVLLVLMSAFSVQMYAAWGNLALVGAVFVRIILITTMSGIGLGMFYHQRTWCSFCPMGSLASWISSRKKSLPLKVDAACVNCKLCTTVCPLQLKPYEGKGNMEGFVGGDCLKCSRCVEKCPKKALSF